MDLVMKKISDKIIECECGSFFCNNSAYNKHLKSDIHRRKIEYINDVKNQAIENKYEYYDGIKVKCVCGSIVDRNKYSQHCRTIKHHKFINENDKFFFQVKGVLFY